jgi:hypothetical protein
MEPSRFQICIWLVVAASILTPFQVTHTISWSFFGFAIIVALDDVCAAIREVR